MTPKFILDKPQIDVNPSKQIPTFVFMKMQVNGSPFRYATGLKLKPALWSKTHQVVLDDSLPNSGMIRQLKDLVELYKKEANRAFRNGETDQQYSADGLKQFLDTKLGRVKEQPAPKPQKIEQTSPGNSFFQFVEKLIRAAEEGTIDYKGKKYTVGTVKNWKRTRNILKEFKPDMDFGNITIDTYQAFKTLAQKRNLTANYIGVLVKDWKTFLQRAYEAGLHTNMIHRDPRFEKLKEKVELVYLNDKEIDLLKNLDLRESPMKEAIRDRFIISLFTGLRISDMKLLTEDNFTKGYIHQVNKKTGKTVTIPIDPDVQDILNKYGGKLPKQYHEVNVNRYIKLIAKQAGINERVTFSRIIGGRKVDQTFKKWELITTHTARRSMVTNMLKAGFTPNQLSKVVGMSLSTLEHYNKISSIENAELMYNHDYYQKKLLQRQTVE